ncbi:hypothetical protein PHLGIDRAFT_320485 [Phlebiopsis gigantea 11061_1 CR5-6]|uniref:Cytochrome P450 n=1 Tax=Phlebiopsis gigantea (strain 11061_1 CR5-6) TaxID=745531 RepID=A0A0C3RQB0_PHLG1|nr:hypothetical protein PHLGIDRAFT_320485 [Phlebiopsis gigantea 11061_1 CR5-6]
MVPITLLVSAVSAYVVIELVLNIRRARKLFSGCPVAYTLLPSSPIWALLLRNPLPGIVFGSLIDYVWSVKYDAFTRNGRGHDIFAIVSFLPGLSAYYLISDTAIVKEITHNRTRFPKDTAVYKFLAALGNNILVAEGDQWKHYRKLSATAFSEKNNRLVWDESWRIMNELLNQRWGALREAHVEDVLNLTSQISLQVMGAAGFGRNISWNDDDIVQGQHQLTFKQSLEAATSNVLLRMVLPKWVYKLQFINRVKEIKLAFDELEIYIHEMIDSRLNAAEKNARYDLLTALIDANEGDRLSHGELLSHVLIFQLAGYETTAHSLSFTLALLALHPEAQEKLFRHIVDTWDGCRVPGYRQVEKLSYCKAVIYETLRMFPLTVNEDTTLTSRNTLGDEVIIPVLKGSQVGVDVVGLHYNPRYWPEPHTFNPDRFLGEWNREAFMPYSLGPRSCLGRNFFEAEAIAILTSLVRNFKIAVRDEPRFATESWEERKNRILQVNTDGISLCPGKISLTLTRR